MSGLGAGLEVGLEDGLEDGAGLGFCVLVGRIGDCGGADAGLRFCIGCGDW